MTVTVTRRAEVPATVDATWAVLGRFGALARWAPNVDHSCLQRGPEPVAVGAVRRVQAGRATLLETVVECEAPHRLAYDISGLPPVLRAVRNTWLLTPSTTGTDVALTTTVDVGRRPPQQLIARVAAWRLARESAAMLRGLADAAASKPSTTGGESGD